jgi:ABC-type transport system involved in multi-copper enzyme maturation permease subunit
MINIIKNEFISTKKSMIITLNILIIASTALMYFANIKLSGVEIFTQYDIGEMFFRSTLKVLAPFIVLLIAKVATEEFSNGGMKIYLINPISRSEVLIGKSIFVFINIIITMIIQMLLSFIAAYVLVGVPSVDFISDTVLDYLVTLIPVVGLIFTIMIPGFLMKTSRHTMSFGFALIVIFDVVASFYEKLNPYSIVYIMKNIADSNQDLISNSLISLAYIIIGFLVSNYIFSKREIR